MGLARSAKFSILYFADYEDSPSSRGFLSHRAQATLAYSDLSSGITLSVDSCASVGIGVQSVDAGWSLSYLYISPVNHYKTKVAAPGLEPGTLCF